MAASNMPAAEVAVDVTLVRALLEEQFPALAGATLTIVANGWDNVMFRLGDDLAVRLPRRAAGVPLIENEQRWLPELAGSLPLPVPSPVHVGVPGHGYPWGWSICPWLPGVPAALAPPDDLASTAEQLATFLAALHRPAPAEAPANPLRGVPVTARLEAWDAALHAVAEHVDERDRGVARRCWTAAASAPVWSEPPVWIHGDLHPANLLVDGGRLCAVIDFGDIAAGDPASDLAAAWMLLDPASRRILRERTPYDGATWMRAHGWAMGFGVVFLANSADNPLIASIGRRCLAQALADARD